MVLRPNFSQFTPKSEIKPFSTTNWLKDYINAFHIFFVCKSTIIKPYNKKFAQKTWFHLFFCVEALVLAEIRYFSSFSEFNKSQILYKISILMVFGPAY